MAGAVHGGLPSPAAGPPKGNRSAAYACRHIAKNMVAAGVTREMLVQVSYAIGKAEPINIFVDTYGTAREGIDDALIAEKIKEPL